MVAVGSSEMLVNRYKTTIYHNPEEQNLKIVLKFKTFHLTTYTVFSVLAGLWLDRATSYSCHSFTGL
jgi:hypothetical protein